MISIIVAAVLPAVMGQSMTLSNVLPDPTDCIGTSVTMSSCSAYFSKYTTCFENNNPNSQASCYCPQTVLDELAGCHQEWWDCYATSDVDSLFTGTNGFYYEWSTVCEEAFSVFSYTPTTSSINSAVTIADQAFCNQVLSDCNSLTVAMTSCASAYTLDSDLAGCLCNDEMLYFGSRCDIDGNEKCLLTTLDPASVYSNQICGTASVAAGTSQASSRPASTSAEIEPASTYTPPTPSSTASPGSPTPSTPAGNGASKSTLSQQGLVGALFVYEE
ncbi:hypothetical protein DL98DRAFT_591411 [Cadophora sp. DSE1049]|nr:hypothetical protein DL98DRAFT_591411 [Cadophora sp. DSE1049]